MQDRLAVLEQLGALPSWSRSIGRAAGNQVTDQDVREGLR
jgi:hypothetical protein